MGYALSGTEGTRRGQVIIGIYHARPADLPVSPGIRNNDEFLREIPLRA